ncbi:(Fe-S)-binding protein [Luteococcus sp. Sow4_B9]|uniref:(Fe-S)-binding protein n=1 Tax=Luteococcus sp. Sow4_B9 TaxID=3438792 RepID=UPI003F9C91F0
MSTTLPGQGKTVALFATCINDAMFPNTPKAVVDVLERLGCTVEFPEGQTCCGQAFTNSGYFDETIPLVRNYAKVFADYDYILGPSGSCVGAVREQHEMLAERTGDAGLVAEVKRVAGNTYDFTELLVDVLGVTDVGAYFPHRVTYHPTCHSMRVAKVGDRPYQLLQAVRGIELVELPDANRCCGFGGTFSLKNPDVSVAMASDKARHVASTGAEYLVAGDNACLLNISGVLNRQQSGIKPIHLAEILASTDESLTGVAR